METIHEIIKESVSGGFWKFCGYWIMVYLVFGIPAWAAAQLANSLFKYAIMRKQG
jgi:hypothetical protein